MEEDFEYKRIVLIRRVIIGAVIGVILLLLFLIFSLSSSSSKKKNASAKIENNLAEMKEVARTYFTNDLLKEGKDIISLKSMYDNKMIDKLTDINGEECIDIASYALVRTIDDEYQLEVVLVCGDNTVKMISKYDAACGLGCEEIMSNIER